MEHTLAEMRLVNRKRAKARRNQMRSKISPSMQKLEQTHGLCADGSAAGNDALASSGGCAARRHPASPGSQSEGTRSGEPALAKKNICSNRGEPVSTERFFSRALHFSGYLAAVSGLAFSDPAGVTPCAAWHSAQGLFYFTLYHRI